MSVELGRKYKDCITGFTGIATGRCEYISGCNQALIAPETDEKGAYRDSQWFDEQRLESIGSDVIVLDNGANHGFDAPAPKR